MQHARQLITRFTGETANIGIAIRLNLIQFAVWKKYQSQKALGERATKVYTFT